MNTASEGSKFRTLQGPLKRVETSLLTLMVLSGVLFVLDVHLYLGKVILREQFLGLFLALVLASVFLGVPASGRSPRDRVPWYDLVLALLGLTVGLYVAIVYPRILFRLAVLTPDKWLLGALAILLILESARRLTGWVLIIIVLLFILYARFAFLFPGVLYGKGFSWQRLAAYLYLDNNSLLGLPMAVGSTIVLAFVLFGNFLFATGGGRFFTDLSLALLGRFRGGPAKVAVVASSLFGTISGSAVSNVATTGMVTIPMMKNTGYRPHVAGAIEAVASTGGQLAPPVMGAAAFLIAEFLEISYAQVAIAAFIPAVLYYLALFVQVDLEAAKYGLRGLPFRELPSLRSALWRGWVFIIPLAVLIYTLFILHLRPAKAGIAAVVVTALLSFLSREMRLNWSKALGILERTGRSLLDLMIIVAAAGLVIGVLQLSGLGFTLALNLIHLSGGSVILLLLLAAGISIVLGMGMPTVAVYILLAVLVAPALTELGISPLAAHLFIFYFGLMSMITPPVCLAAYAGASIAGSEPVRTGFEGMRLGAVAYIVPFVFVFSPALLLVGSPGEVGLAIVTAILGAILLGISFSGFLFRELTWMKRGLLILAAFGLLLPSGQGIFPFTWVSDVMGAAFALFLLMWEWQRGRLHPMLRGTPSPGTEGQ
ncbi:MAG: TRAP transporter permease [Candidatus Binatia bacterium]